MDLNEFLTSVKDFLHRNAKVVLAITKKEIETRHEIRIEIRMMYNHILKDHY